MKRESLSRRSFFGRLFGCLGLLLGAGRLRSRASTGHAPDVATPRGIISYTYDDFGRLVSIDEGSASRDATSSIV